jgi:ABC-type sugar transport system ATPase subunit
LASVDLRGLTKRFGSLAVVDNVSLRIDHGQLVCLLGPSGCGKTTTLRLLAGFLEPSDGEILVGDRLVSSQARTLPPEQRKMSMIFQSYALWPHMTVAENIVYGLRLRKIDRDTIAKKLKLILETTKLEILAQRYPGELSGGQQQRVALARALIKQPDLLLFDEPLSNLDARLRLTTRSEIKRLQREFGITSLFVTHDQVEALTMASRIAVMRAGKLEAYGTPNELYERPQTRFVASFIGHPPMNMLPATLGQEGGQTVVRTAYAQVGLPESLARRLNGNGQAGREVIFGLRPEDLYPDDNGQIAGEVDLVEPLGRDDLLVVRTGESQVHALAPAGARLRTGDSVRLRLDPEHIHLFDPTTERSLLWS